MAPGAIQNGSPTTHSASGLKATAREFRPSGAAEQSRYHATSSNAAISEEAEYAAHNYHPLPIGMWRIYGNRLTS
jgi:ornithine--oxo-acid transaminase